MARPIHRNESTVMSAQLTRVERRKEKTRRTLGEVALGLFYERSIYWTKIEDITQGADVGKGTFYQYFETKEALIQELLQEGLNLLLARLEEVIPSLESSTSVLQEIIHAKLDFYVEHPEYLLLFHQVCGLLQVNTQGVKGMREVYQGYLDRLGRMLRPALNGTSHVAASDREFAMALSAFTSGLMVHHLLFDKGDFKHRREVIQAQLDRSLQALL